MFTYQYIQPKEYRFSLDSIQFAKLIAEHLRPKQDLKSLRVLDLCAGCGVIGFELAWHLRDLRQFDFVEVQDIYTDFFHENVKIVNRSELQMRWHVLNYDVLLEKHWENKFDLIISNPPYFLKDHGTLSPSVFKNRCRFYLDSSFENFICAMVNALAVGGEAFFLLRPLVQHGYDLFFNVQELLKGKNILVEKIFQVRGNEIIRLKKTFSKNNG